MGAKSKQEFTETEADRTVSNAAPGRSRGAARRQSILDAAVRLFAKRGFRAAGILALAQDVGMTHVGVLHHFGSKEELLRAVVARREAEEVALVESSTRLGGIAALKDMVRHGHQLVANPLYPRLFTVLIAESLDAEDPLHEYFVARYQRVRSAMARAVRDGQRLGEIRPDVDADRVAAEILSFIVGTQVQWLLDPDGIDVNGAYERYLGRLIEDLAMDRNRLSGQP